MEQFKIGQKQFAFRGQADSEWLLQTSLARHFLANHVKDDEWRLRELKMYRRFRELLFAIYRDMHKDWKPMDILSLMQHHHAPTRLLDFTYDSKVAAYFALEDSRRDSAIWVVDTDYLEQRRKDLNLPEYWGPTHDPYEIAEKDEQKNYRLGGTIQLPDKSHERLAAQNGCFLVTGSISQFKSEELVHTKVILSKELVIESLQNLEDQGYNRKRLFPNLEKIAKEAKRFSVVGCSTCN